MPYRQMDNNNGEAGKVRNDAPVKQFLVRRSKRLPPWLWITIAHSLGIRIHPNDKPILAIILYILTLISASVLVLTTATHAVAVGVYHSHGSVTRATGHSGSNNDEVIFSTPSTNGHLSSDVILDGLAMVSLTLFWCLLGLYSKNLAQRLYSSARFLEMVRLHAKTVLKINAAFVFFLLITTFVIVNNVQAYDTWYANRSTCSLVGLPVLVCQTRFIALCVFSIFAILWNSLVGMVLLSVCRTNTMGIRRFIQDLEKDAAIYEKQQFGANASSNDLLWLTDNDADLSSEGEADSKPRKRIPTLSNSVSSNNNEFLEPQNPSTDEDTKTAKIPIPTTPRIVVMSPSDPSRTMELLSVTSPSAIFCATPSAYQCNLEGKEEASPMSTALILQRYWKLSCSARLSSTTFQRWTTCVTTICLTWVAIGLVQWLSYTPRPLQVVQIVVPLMILPLLCAAYAEVNVEGKRLLKCICPIEQRLAALYVMWQSPPQMSIFGMTITYGAMGTAAAGLLLALASRVVLKQLGAGGS